MTPLSALLYGLSVLGPLDPAGSVFGDVPVTLYAGPQSADLSDHVVKVMQDLGWHFDQKVGRWGYRL